MYTPDQLIAIFTKLFDENEIDSKSRTELRQTLVTIKADASTKERKRIEKIIAMLTKETVSKSDSWYVIESVRILANVLKRYEAKNAGESNSDDESDPDNESNTESEPDFADEPDVAEGSHKPGSETLSVDAAEKLLDAEVPKYNGFSERNIMTGVAHNQRKYVLQYKGKLQYEKDVELAVTRFKALVEADLPGKKLVNPSKISFQYHNKYFVSYWDGNTPYFDIWHIIGVLNLEASTCRRKYKQFSTKSQLYIWHPNEYGGFILRRLLSEETMYKLILSSNSTLSKSFKEDVSKILPILRKDGQVEITNGSINITNGKIKPIMETEPIVEIKPINPKEIHVDHSTPIAKRDGASAICRYDSHPDLLYVKQLIENSTNIVISKYMNKHILYCFIVTIDTDHCDVVVKIGYTEDIISRIKSLRAEYQAQICPIRIKMISGQSDEVNFHQMIRVTYPKLIEKRTIRGKGKTELYKLSPQLINEFDSYLNQAEGPEENVKVNAREQKIIDYIKKQECTFTDRIAEYEQKIQTKDPSMLYNYLMVKENKEIELKKLELQIIREQNESIRLQIEAKKSLK